MREEAPYEVPAFAANADKPLVYVSFGSLGSGDTDLLKRLIAAFAQAALPGAVQRRRLSRRVRAPPPNVHLASWYPQPSVIPQVDAVIHHGGNNSFTECLYFGKPAIIMPYVWDGHDNATRVHETRHGLKMPRYDWTEADLARNLETLLTDPSHQGQPRPRQRPHARPQRHREGGGPARRAGAAMSTAPHLADAATRDDLVDWGPIATPLEGLSRTSGKVLHKDAGRRRERDLGLHARDPGAARSSARSSATSWPGAAPTSTTRAR